VIIEEIPAPLTNVAFDTMVSKFAGTVYQSPALNLRCPDQSLAEIKALMKTGAGSIDSDIDQWLAARGDTWLIELWEGVFQIKERSGTGASKRLFTDWIEDKECGGDYALAIFLLSRKLFDAPLEGTTSHLPQYERTCADYRDQSGARLCRELERIDRNHKNGMLVVKMAGLQVTVCGEVYRDWIAAGGDNDVLFGNALSPMPDILAGQIDAKGDQLKRAWMRHAGLVATVERNQQFNRTKDYFARHFQDQLTELANTEAGDLGNMAMLQKAFMLELEKVKESDFDCLYSLALKLVCEVRFPEKASYEILAGIDRNQKENPTLPVREAAMLAVLEYICCWLASQIKPVTQ